MSTSPSPRQSRTPLVQAALNGRITRADHPAAPMTAEDFVRDAIAVAAVGAGAIHLHPRDAAGAETVDPAVVNDLVTRVKAASGIPVGITTGEWIEGLRLAAIRGWTAPDYASVNLSEEGSVRVMEALLAAGVGIEAGLATVDDAAILIASGLASRVTRILVEPWSGEHANDADAVLATAHAIHAALDRAGIDAPRLQHGDGAAAWPLLRDAIACGWDTRIGLEDTLVCEDGGMAETNAALVKAAIILVKNCTKPGPPAH